MYTLLRGSLTSLEKAAIEALMLMKNIMSKSHPDIMLAGTSDGGVNGTPDEVFAAQRVGYYNKYFNAPLRMAQYWDNPSDLRMGPLPKFAGGEGLYSLLDYWSCPLQARSEQGKGCRIRQGADLRPANLERLHRWNRNCASGTATTLQVPLFWLEIKQTRLATRLCRPRSRTVGPSQGDHQSPLRSPAICYWQTNLGILPQG